MTNIGFKHRQAEICGVLIRHKDLPNLLEMIWKKTGNLFSLRFDTARNTGWVEKCSCCEKHYELEADIKFDSAYDCVCTLSLLMVIKIDEKHPRCIRELDFIKFECNDCRLIPMLTQNWEFSLENLLIRWIPAATPPGCSIKVESLVFFSNTINPESSSLDNAGY